MGMSVSWSLHLIVMLPKLFRILKRLHVGIRYLSPWCVPLVLIRTGWNALVESDKNTKRQNAQQALMQKMTKGFEEQITRLGAVQAAQSQLTVASVQQVEGCDTVTPTGSCNWPEVNPAPPVQSQSVKLPKLSQFSRAHQLAWEESSFEQWMFEVKAAWKLYSDDALQHGIVQSL